MAEEIGSLKGKILLEAEQFSKKMKETKDNLKGLGDEAKKSSKETKKSFDEMDDSFEKTKKQTKGLGDQTKTSVDDMNQSFNKLNKSLRDAGMSSEQIQRINEQVRKVHPEILEKEIQDVRTELHKLGMSSKEIDKITKEMRNADKAAEDFSAGIDDIQTASMAFGAAVAAVYGGSIALAANFEQKMKDVEAVSGATAEEMDKLTDLAMEMGEKTAFSASEAAAGIEELVKAGLSVEQIMSGGLQGALDLATAGGLDLAQAAEIASTALNTFESNNLSVADAANILAGAANASSSDVAEMQYGLSQVGTVAEGVKLSFQDTSTALAVFAANGLKGSDAGTSLKTMLSNLQPTTKAQIELFMDLGLMTEDGTNKFFDQEGRIKSLADVSGLLQDSMEDMTDQQRALALETLFGSDAVRAGTILYKEGADGINEMWSAMSKVTAADVAKTKLDTLKGSFEELKGVLETVGIEIGDEFLPLLTDIVRQGTDVIRSLDDMDMANVNAALAFGGTAAAVALVGSSLLKLVSAARLLFASMGPAGWLITGLSLVAGAVMGAKVGMDDFNEVNLEAAETMQKNHDALSADIAQYDELKVKLQLSTDELGRFVDINSEMQKTTDPTILARLKEEQDKLQKKSGLTNDQLAKLLELNGKIIETVPGATGTITDQGNALMDSTDKAKKYNDQQLELLRTELQRQQANAEANMNENLGKERDLVKEIKNLNQERNSIQTKISEGETAIAEKTRLLAIAKEEGNKAAISLLEREIKVEERNLQINKEENAELSGKITKKTESLNKTREEIAALDRVKNKMIELELRQVGLNAKKGQEVQQINSAISKLETEKRRMQEQTPVAQRKTEEYQKAVAKIDAQIRKLQEARGRVQEITNSAKTMNATLGKDISKTVTVTNRTIEERVSIAVRGVPGHRENYHTGGIVGRGQMPKLHVGGLASQFMNAPLHNEIDVRLLRNEAVLTEAQQANLMRLIDAGHTNTAGTNRDTPYEQTRPIEVTVHNYTELDGRELARGTYRYTTEFQKNEEDMKNEFRGIKRG